ncbi:Gldg family protein [Woodsholea maritima]|uniref:Gldg family protein n=1 Tax=Woodsholea maritima TaxID=240237 RepID=UPI000361A505|nr:Gldg family protein [Woodsholea maritima]
MNSARHIALVTLALICGFVGLNLLAGVLTQSVRLDLTEQQLYRLSPGARDILQDIGEPIDLEFYYSRADAAQYPAIRAYGARVRGLLRTIEAEARGQIRLREIDPKPFSEDEDAAIAAGLTQIPGEGGTPLFFGLRATNSVDDARIVDVFDPSEEARLEYDILRLIAELDRADTPHIAVVSSLALEPVEGGDNHPLVAELQRAYQLTWLDRDFETLPESTDLLVVWHPGRLTDHQLYLIDQFALHQGRILAILDPLAHMALKPGRDGLPPIDAQRSSNLGNLLGQWGMGYDTTQVVMDRQQGLPVQVVEADGRPRMRAYPLWFSVPQAGLAAGDPTTANLSRGINLGSPGLLSPLEGASTQFTPLMMTSDEGAVLDVDIVATSPSPDDVARLYEGLDLGQQILAARLSGVINTAFPNGPPAQTDARLIEADHAEISDGPVDIIVIADADWLDPNFFLSGDQIVADNITLALNWLDSLAGDRALLGLRSRASSIRPMVRVEALRAEAEDRYLELQTQFETRLLEAETRLQALREQGSASALTRGEDESGANAEALRQEILETRARLRDIERGFHRDIDALERQLMIWTLWAPAGGILLIGLIVFFIRRRRRA